MVILDLIDLPARLTRSGRNAHPSTVGCRTTVIVIDQVSQLGDDVSDAGGALGLRAGCEPRRRTAAGCSDVVHSDSELTVRDPAGQSVLAQAAPGNCHW
jgi:hypothetical protein